MGLQTYLSTVNVLLCNQNYAGYSIIMLNVCNFRGGLRSLVGSNAYFAFFVSSSILKFIMLNVLMSCIHDACHIDLHMTICATMCSVFLFFSFIYSVVLIASVIYSSYPGSNLMPISSLQLLWTSR